MTTRSPDHAAPAGPATADADPAARTEALYRDFHAHLRDYLMRLCRNSHLADDLASETFERALRALQRPGFGAPQSPAAWLDAIARNLLADHFRRASSKREITVESVCDDGALDPGAEAVLLAAESLQETYERLDVLSPGQREVLILRTLEGYSTAETAALMGRSQQAVRSLRHKALRRLAVAPATPAPANSPGGAPDQKALRC